MSPWEQQHFVLNVHETFQRFSPKVPDHFYSIKFVPVIDEGETSYKPLPRSLLTTFGPDSDQPPHRLQVRSGCWCDLSSRAFFDQGLLYPSWVIEIHISRPDVEDPRTKNFWRRLNGCTSRIGILWVTTAKPTSDKARRRLLCQSHSGKAKAENTHQR